MSKTFWTVVLLAALVVSTLSFWLAYGCQRQLDVQGSSYTQTGSGPDEWQYALGFKGGGEFVEDGHTYPILTREGRDAVGIYRWVLLALGVGGVAVAGVAGWRLARPTPARKPYRRSRA